MNRLTSPWIALIAAWLALTVAAAAHSPYFKPARPNATVGQFAAARRS